MQDLIVDLFIVCIQLRNLQKWCCRVKQKGILNVTLHYRWSEWDISWKTPRSTSRAKSARVEQPLGIRQWNRGVARPVEQPFYSSLDNSRNLANISRILSSWTERKKNETCTSLDRSSVEQILTECLFKTRFARLNPHFSPFSLE